MALVARLRASSCKDPTERHEVSNTYNDVLDFQLHNCELYMVPARGPQTVFLGNRVRVCMYSLCDSVCVCMYSICDCVCVYMYVQPMRPCVCLHHLRLCVCVRTASATLCVCVCSSLLLSQKDV